MIVIDNFIKDQQLLDDLKNDTTFFNTKVICGGMVGGTLLQIQLRKD